MFFKMGEVGDGGVGGEEIYMGKVVGEKGFSDENVVIEEDEEREPEEETDFPPPVVAPFLLLEGRNHVKLESVEYAMTEESIELGEKR